MPILRRLTQESKLLDIVDILPERRVDLIRVQHTGMVSVIRLGPIGGTHGYHLQSLDRGIGHGDDEAYIE